MMGKSQNFKVGTPAGSQRTNILPKLNKAQENDSY